MKLNKFFLLGMAGLAFAACSNEDDVAINGGDGVNKTMVVSIAGISSGTTRATAPVDPWTQDTQDQGVNNIQSLFLAFTDANGVVKYTFNTSQKEGSLDNLKTDGMKFTGVEGVTAVYAVANTPTGFTLNVGSNINSVNTQFSQQGISTAAAKTAVVYVGGDTDITPLRSEEAVDGSGAPFTDDNTFEFGEEGSYYYTANITLRPIISRFQIKSVKVATSGESNTFPTTATPTVAVGQFKYTWSGFEPTLHGVYLNNFYTEFTDLTGATDGLMNEPNYADHITGGQWLMGETNQNFANDAAYINYAGDAYGTLLTYGAGETEGAITYKELVPEGTCLAFNVFVPFNIITGNTMSDQNPTIHFQFDTEVTDYDKTPVYAIAKGNITAGTEVTEQTNAEDYAFVNAANENIDLTLPVMNDFMFANVRTLYEEAEHTTELTMEPGKIYNMEIVINPVNMQYDLTVEETNNVVVMIEVVDFTEQNIYPELD